MSVTAAAGFVASGIAAGIKESGDPDLALVATATGRAVPAAGVFTSNLMTAAPVLVSQRPPGLDRRPGRGRDPQQRQRQRRHRRARSGRTPRPSPPRWRPSWAATEDEVLVCSTGLIGIPLPVDALLGAVPDLVAGVAEGEDAGAAAAEALRTTDTVRKEAVATAGAATVGGMAKGAAMLAAEHGHHARRAHHRRRGRRRPPWAGCCAAGVDASFNRLLTDGCTSTNDTVLLLAIGRGRTGRRTGPRRCGGRGLHRPRRADGRGRRGGDQGGPPHRGRRRHRRRGPHRGPRPSPAACSASARGTGGTRTGAVWPASWAWPASPSTRSGWRSPTAAPPWPPGACRSTTTPTRWPTTWTDGTWRSPAPGHGGGHRHGAHQRPDPRLRRREHGHQ